MLALAIMLFGLIHGLVEGQIMVQNSDPMYGGGDPDRNEDGVRCHRWFRWYHWFGLARYAALIAIVVCLYQFPDAGKMVTAGAAFLGWQFSEMAYHFARWGKVITGQENVFGVWNLTNSADVWLLNSVRFLAGVGLLAGGLL